ncbi:MAG: hypothetical protein ACQEQR_04985 [Pseudomonadota bacterium]
MKLNLPLNPSEIQQRQLQQQLSKSCFWDDIEQTLWIDCRKVLPAFGVLNVPSWDALTMSSAKIPPYPSSLRILDWSNYSQISYWRKQIPQWVQDSCALFPTHQLTLLHYTGKYPQVLELLDHSPMLAWRLITAGLEESEIVVLLSGKRQVMVGQVGWPEKVETVKFLRNLRLRLVNDEIADQIEICLMDEQRLTALQRLPRINSMALSLAARFPELIGCKLHHALAQLPCRPMQCQSMVALLEDAYRLAQARNLPPAEIEKIGNCRYLVEVTEIYQAWLKVACDEFVEEMMRVDSARQAQNRSTFQERLCAEPKVIRAWQDWVAVSRLQQHAWWLDYATSGQDLMVWQDEKGVWSALFSQYPDESINDLQTLVRVRGEDNCLPGAKPLSDLHLWQARLLPQGD